MCQLQFKKSPNCRLQCSTVVVVSVPIVVTIAQQFRTGTFYFVFHTFSPFASYFSPSDEGLPLYIPMIEPAAKYLINYNQTVTNIKGIVTSPTGLESTSLVFAYGLGKPHPRPHPL